MNNESIQLAIKDENNSTSGSSRSVSTMDLLLDVAKYQLYILQGGACAFVNIVMIATLFYHSVLRKRKEYLIVGSLAFADFLSGSGVCNAA